MGYEQMEFDVTLSGDRELKDNVGIAVEFACRQVAAENRKTVESNHEGYGIAAEGKVAFEAVKLAANADKVMNDLYTVAQNETTPIEEYLDKQDGEFEEAAEQDPEEVQEEETDAE